MTSTVQERINQDLGTGRCSACGGHIDGESWPSHLRCGARGTRPSKAGQEAIR